MSNAVTAQQNKFNPHLLFWCVFLAAIMVFIGIFKAVLLPFVLGIAVAYLLDPVVEKITCITTFQNGKDVAIMVHEFTKIVSVDHPGVVATWAVDFRRLVKS